MDNKILIASLFCLATTSASAQRIEAVNEVIDCGQVEYMSPVTVDFEIKNKGNRGLVIKDVLAGCGCTSTNYPKAEIGGGEKATINVTYDSKQMGRFDKLIEVYSNGSKEPIALRMKGIVVREVVDFAGNYPFSLGGILADKNEIEFDDVNSGDRPQQKIHIRNNSSSPIQPVVMHLPNYLLAEVSPSKIASGHSGVITLTLDSKRLKDMGLTSTSVFVGSFPGDKVSPTKEIGVSAVLLPSFKDMAEKPNVNGPKVKLSATELNLGEFGSHKRLKGEIEVRNDGYQTLEIERLQMFSQGIQVSLNKQKIKPGEEAKLKVTAERKLYISARSKPRVLMITNDPSQPKVIIKINAK